MKWPYLAVPRRRTRGREDPVDRPTSGFVGALHGCQIGERADIVSSQEQVRYGSRGVWAVLPRSGRVDEQRFKVDVGTYPFGFPHLGKPNVLVQKPGDDIVLG